MCNLTNNLSRLYILAVHLIPFLSIEDINVLWHVSEACDKQPYSANIFYDLQKPTRKIIIILTAPGNFSMYLRHSSWLKFDASIWWYLRRKIVDVYVSLWRHSTECHRGRRYRFSDISALLISSKAATSWQWRLLTDVLRYVSVAFWCWRKTELPGMT